MAGIWAASLGRLPSTFAERAWTAWRLSQRPAREDEAPLIFILGYWRSGTTHLYNVMAKGGFGYVPPLATGLPHDFLLLGRALRPLLERMLPRTRFIDNVAVAPDSPQEDEIALANMCDLSFYHGLYFPAALTARFERAVFPGPAESAALARWQHAFEHLTDKLRLAFPGQPLLIKNPVYTARLGRLAEMYPEARFIYIHRNPYELFASMRNFFDRLLEQFAIQPWDPAEIDPLILDSYARMTAAFEHDRAHLAPGRLVELSYEDLCAAPLDNIEHIYDGLSLAGFERARPAFARYLDSVRGYARNRYSFPPELIEKVDRHWGEIVARQGYGRPARADADMG